MLRIMASRRGFAFVVSLAVAAALCGCAGNAAARKGAEPTLLESAATAYLARDYATAVTQYTDFLGTNPGSDRAAEAYYGRGNAYFGMGRYDLAESDYREAASQSKERNTRALATMGLGNAAMAQGRFDAATKVYKQVMSQYSGSVPQDEVLYRLGLSCARDGKWDDAEDNLQQVITAWPSGEYARLARAKLAAVKTRSFTVQVGAFSSRQLADQASRRLLDAKLPSRIEPVEADGVTLYAVRSGSFATWSAATAHATKVRAAGFEQPLVTP